MVTTDDTVHEWCRLGPIGSIYVSSLIQKQLTDMRGFLASSLLQKRKSKVPGSPNLKHLCYFLQFITIHRIHQPCRVFFSHRRICASWLRGLVISFNSTWVLFNASCTSEKAVQGLPVLLSAAIPVCPFLQEEPAELQASEAQLLDQQRSSSLALHLPQRSL